MFEDFDFSALYDITFKEDAVREEIIAPVLRRAGFKPTGALRVQRSKPLTHPFVMIGSKKHPVNIVPDYTLFCDDAPLMILDAKKPSEEIVNSVHVEQAYSYAIHPEVRCEIYGLSNGRNWSIFHISRSEPLLVMPTAEIDARSEEFFKHFDPKILKTPDILDFHADFGLHAYRAGIKEGELFRFEGYHLQLVASLHEHMFTIDSTCAVNDREHMISFDFDLPALEKALAALPPKVNAATREALKRNPFQADLEAKINIDCTALLSAPVQGPYELFAPFRVVDVTASRYNPDAVRTPHPSGRPSDMPDWIFRVGQVEE